jgi:hypothetical protein
MDECLSAEAAIQQRKLLGQQWRAYLPLPI